MPFASAQTPPKGVGEESPTEGKSDADLAKDNKAREHYLRGQRYYSEGDYKTAISEFQRAYDLSGRPKLLFNLANAHERLANYEQAIALLRTYAKTVPSYEHDAIARRIRNIEKRADENSLKDVPPNPATSDGGDVNALEPSPLDTVSLAPSTSDTASGSTLGWVLVGTGVVLAAGGAASGFLALNARDDANALCQNGHCSENAMSAIDDDKLYSTVSDIGIGLGAATALTGLFLVWRGKDKEQSPVSARVQSNGLNVSYSGSF